MKSIHPTRFRDEVQRFGEGADSYLFTQGSEPSLQGGQVA